MQTWSTKPNGRRGKRTAAIVKPRQRSRGWRVVDLHREVDRVRVVKARRYARERDFDDIEREQWARHLIATANVHYYKRKSD